MRRRQRFLFWTRLGWLAVTLGAMAAAIIAMAQGRGVATIAATLAVAVVAGLRFFGFGPPIELRASDPRRPWLQCPLCGATVRRDAPTCRSCGLEVDAD